jgi:hypothetical protein
MTMRQFIQKNRTAIEEYLDLFLAVLAPPPDKSLIDMEQTRDMNNNPHNDHYKPKRRSREEIECELRHGWVKTLRSTLK